jgi:hypothetical protein
MAATKEELKRLLIQARFEKEWISIPCSGCPNAYSKPDYRRDCNGYSSDCDACKHHFKKALYKQIEKEVMAL